MEVKHIQIRELKLQPKELTDGSYKLSGMVKFRGRLDARLAKDLSLGDASEIEALKTFKVEREKETVAFQLKPTNGKDILAEVPAAVMHEWTASRAGGDILIGVKARIDVEGHDLLADFMKRHASWSGRLLLQPAQREIDFK